MSKRAASIVIMAVAAWLVVLFVGHVILAMEWPAFAERSTWISE